MALLGVFKTLKMREGYVLRAYVFRAQSGGNGVIWAMPEDFKFPEPNACNEKVEGFIDYPKPPGAQDDLMVAVEGDGSPWSYLQASLFGREAFEFGAWWHGCSWSNEEIIEADLGLDSREWKWRGQRPTTWEPMVEIAKRSVRVRFFTYNRLIRESIIRHEDTFNVGRYSFKAKTVTIATGPGGTIS